MAKKITFLKGNLCVLKFFIDVLYIFLFGAKEKLQFEMDFVLNLPCVQPIVLGCRIHDPGSVMRIGLKD